MEFPNEVPVLNKELVHWGAPPTSLIGKMALPKAACTKEEMRAEHAGPVLKGNINILEYPRFECWGCVLYQYRLGFLALYQTWAWNDFTEQPVNTIWTTHLPCFLDMVEVVTHFSHVLNLWHVQTAWKLQLMVSFHWMYLSKTKQELVWSVHSEFRIA